MENKTEIKYAGFWIRFLAILIDGVILGLILTPILRIIFPVDVQAVVDGGAASVQLGGTASSIQSLITLAYYVIMTVMYGGTLGKMAMKIQVVGEDMKKIDWGKAILRELVGKFVSGIVLGIGFIWAGFDAKKQGWHDKIAKTYVVYK